MFARNLPLRRWLLPGLVVCTAGCATLPPPQPRVAPAAPVLELAERADRALRENRVADALGAARAAVEAGPGDAEGWRIWQAARLAAGLDAGVRDEAVRRSEEQPGDALRLYLRARTEPDAAAALGFLRDALRADPSHLWARLGIAQLLAALGDRDGARAALDAAEVVAPGHPWVPLLRAGIAAEEDDPLAALAHLEEAVRRDPAQARLRESLAGHLADIPGREAEARAAWAEAFARLPGARGVAAAWRRILERGAPPEAWEQAVAAVDAHPDPTPAARHLRGAARRRVGDLEGARRDLESALAAGEERTAILDDLRHVLFLQERYVAAVAAERAVTPVGVLHDPAQVRDGVRFALERAARAADARPADPEALAALMAACRAAGWIAEAELVAARRVAATPDDATALAAHAEIVQSRRFLDDLRSLWRGRYFRYATGDEGDDLDEALAAVRAVAERHLGFDVTAGIARRSFGFLGTVAETVRAEGPCRAWFDAHGLALVVGRMIGAPVEARLLRVLSVHRDREQVSLGRRFRATVVVGEGVLVPSLRERGGAVLGGLTVDDLVFLDLEGVARWSGSMVRARRDTAWRAVLEAVPPARAGDRADARSLDVPGLLGERLALQVPRWDDPQLALADFLDAAERHELAHAADAARYLPVWRHPWNGLGLLWRAGFRLGRVASLLEGDAEIVALAEAREPRAALATLVSFLPARDGGTPHVHGYHGALRDLVEVLFEGAPGLPPALSSGRNGPRMLDTVPPEVLRAAAREVCRRRGLLGDGAPAR